MEQARSKTFRFFRPVHRSLQFLFQAASKALLIERFDPIEHRVILQLKQNEAMLGSEDHQRGSVRYFQLAVDRCKVV